MDKNKKRILTGDRPTGPLHLGHYIGSLVNRVKAQEVYEQYVMIADAQALTDNYNNPEKIRKNITEVAMDYLSVGIDPEKTTILIQSQIPEIAELNLFFLNLVTLARLQRNPTVKTEMKQKGFGANVPAGFLTYPVSQAADIAVVKGEVVPVGEDQLPILEQTNEIIRRFNNIYGNGQEILKECQPLLSETRRLPGIDGKAKASKSLGNAIYLSDTREEVARKVMDMYTDPKHFRVEDPGQVKGNVVFTYLDAFDPDKEEVAELKKAYKKGGLGDVAVKKRLIGKLEDILEPIREKRASLKKDEVMEILKAGTKRAQKEAGRTMREVRKAMRINYFEE